MKRLVPSDNKFHKGAKPRWQCTVCSASFDYDDELEARIHADERKHSVKERLAPPASAGTCEMCGNTGIIPVIDATGRQTGSATCPHCGGHSAPASAGTEGPVDKKDEK